MMTCPTTTFALLTLALLTTQACAPTQPSTPSPSTPPPAAKAPQQVRQKLAALPEGHIEERLELLPGQTLVVRTPEFASPLQGFMLGMVDADGGVVDAVTNFEAIYKVPKDTQWPLEGCEDAMLALTTTADAGPDKLLLVTHTCSSGNDSRAFVDRMAIYRMPTTPLKNLGELALLWSGESSWFENLHDMCISGYRSELKHDGRSLVLHKTPFAEFQPDPEFGAVDPEECVAPPAQEPIAIDTAP